MKQLLLPILKKYWKPLLATMLIAAIGCTYTVGLSGGYLSLERSMYEYLDSYGYPDAAVATELTDRSRLAALEVLPGVVTANARACADTVLQNAEGRYLSVRCFSYNDGDRGRFFKWSSADGGGADELYLEYAFAKANGIRAGDRVLVKAGDEWRTFFVGAIVSTPETIAVQPADTGWTLGGDFGYVYVSVHLLEREYDWRSGEAKSALDGKSVELAAARRDAEAALAEAREYLDESAAALAEKEALLADARLEADGTRAQLLSGREALEAQRAGLLARLDALRGARDAAAGRLAAPAEAEGTDPLQTPPEDTSPEAPARRGGGGAALRRFVQRVFGGAAAVYDGLRSRLELTQTDPVSEAEALSAEELEAALSQLDEGISLCEIGLAELDEGIRQLDESLAALDAELAEAARQLDDARAALAEGEEAYRQSLADTQQEFSGLEDELAEAYASLEAEPDYGELCNQFLFWFEPGADPEATLRAAEAALADVTVRSSYTFDESPVVTRIEENLAPIRTLSTFVPSLYFVVLMVITFLFMSLIVRQCRREIGILRAVGKSVGSIRGLFCGVSLIVSLAGDLVGFGLSVFFTWFVGRKTVQLYTLPIFSICFDWAGVGKTFLSNILAGQLATLVSTGVIMKISPAEAMSRPAPSTVRVPGFLGRLTRRMRPMTAFSVTTILRNPLRFIASTICVSATIMGIFSALTSLTSDEYFLYDIYERRIQYDCQIFYYDAVSNETMAQLEALGITEELQRAPIYMAEVAFGGKSEKTAITALEPDTELLRVYDGAGDRLALNALSDGIILEEHLAERLGAQVGDTVTVNGDRRMMVEDIAFQCTSRSQYISLASAETLGKASVSSLICRIAPSDERKLLETLVEQDGYLYSVFSQRAYESYSQQLAAYHFVAWVIILFMVVTGFLIVLNTARTNLLEKKKDLCVLRTLGIRHREISKSWFVQSAAQFLCSGVIGLLLGRGVAEATLRMLSTEQEEFVYANSPKEALITLGCVALYITVSHFAAMRDLKRWDIVENMKEKE